MSYHLAEINRTLVIDGDGFSIWVYLLQEDDESIDFSGFLCSMGTVVDSDAEVERFLQEGNQPPLQKEFENEYSVVGEVVPEDISVEVLDSENLTVSVKGRQYLLLDLAERQSYSIAVAEDGPYGYKLMTAEPDEEE